MHSRAVFQMSVCVITNQLKLRGVDIRAYKSGRNQAHAADDTVHRAEYGELLVVQSKDKDGDPERSTKE
jgi:hypothetical protein